MNDGVKDALRQIEGVRYIVDTGSYKRIVLDHRAPFEVVDEVREVLPVGITPERWGGTQEHLCAIELDVDEE